MMILTQKQITKIKNQALNKIYNALVDLNIKDKALIELGIYDNRGDDRHDELLDIALKHLNSEPTENVYGWIWRGKLKDTFL